MDILLVDDEAELTNALQAMLQREGYHVTVAYDGDRGRSLSQQEVYDLLILDWMLPHISGLKICQEMRSQGNYTPVLFLTAKDTLDDRVVGLDAGADDYLVKPFELRELLARVRALLRRAKAIKATQEQSYDQNGQPLRDTMQGEDLTLDCTNQLAYRQSRLIELSEKETQLLEYLMRHPGQLLTHEQIYQYLWSDTQKPSSNVLAALVRLLRRKVEAIGEAPLIHTVYGKGYRFGSNPD